MDFLEKAKIRLNHWMEHNEEHQKEYQEFANQLEEAGQKGAADSIREMAQLANQSNDCLRKAIEQLPK
jgi:rubrerythrin